MTNEKKVILSIYSISFSIFAALVWFIYIKQPAHTSFKGVEYLPVLNCLLNFFSAVCLVLGIFAIKQRKESIHKKCMILALIFSALFLVSYLFYHHYHGDSPFLGKGLIRPFYFFILISHILLTIIGLPFILTTFYFALTGKFTKHKFLAKFTFPIWLYISITGVLIYILLKVSF